MLPENLAILGAIIASLGGFFYLYETIAGKTQPNKVTWLLWGIFPMITFAAQRVDGVTGVSWATFVAGFVPILILIASLMNKKAYWKSRPLDYACLVTGVIGISLWAITNNANIAILFATFADLCAAIPTVIKCHKHPESESWIAYTISTLGFGFSLLTIHNWDVANYAFLVYLTLMNGLLAVLSFHVQGKETLLIEP